jgi:pimeloyl-ACP methyl ester carboxylesterase/HEAT repeat protein
MRRRILTLVLLLVLPALSGVQAGEKDDLLTLVTRLEDPVTREAAARSLLEKGDAALPVLTKVLKAGDSSDLLRREIVALAPRFGARGIKPLKVALLDRRVELEAVRQLGTIEAADQVFPVMVGALDSGNPKVRTAAIQWIKDTGSTGTDLPTKLFELLNDASEDVRNVAGELIARDLGKDAVPTLMDLFRKEAMRPTRSNLLLRQVLIRTLGVVGASAPAAADRVIPTLIQALDRPDQQKAASAAMVMLGERAVPSLLMVLKQGDVNRAPAAMEAMMLIGPEAAPEVVSLLTARHSKMRDLATQFLSFYRDPSILPILARTYQKGDPLVRASVVSIAGLYRDEEAIRLMELGLKDKDANVRLKAMEMIAKSGLPQTVPLLLSRAEEDPELTIRIAALQALFYLGDTSAVASMVRMLQYEKWPLRLEILKALLWMGRAEHVIAVADQLAHRKPEIANLAERVLSNLSYLEGTRSLEDWSKDVKSIQGARLGKNDTTLPMNRKEIRAGDATIEVLVGGTPDRGTLLLLRSGDALDDPWFLESLRPLADDYRIVLMDFPGCDVLVEDARPEVDRCMAWHAERIELVRSAFTQGTVVLISHSVAAYAAAWYAAKHPDAVSKLVLIAPIYPEPILLRETVRRIEDGISARWRKELEQLESLRGRMNPRAYYRYRNRAELAALVSGQGIASLVGSYYGLSWFLKETYIPETDSDLEAAFTQVRAPVLLVVGENDPVPAASLESFRRIGRIRGNYMIATIPSAMHFPHISKPLIFRSAVVRFLAEVRSGTGPGNIAGAVPSAVVTTGERGLTASVSETSGPISLNTVGPAPVGLAGMLTTTPAPAGDDAPNGGGETGPAEIVDVEDPPVDAPPTEPPGGFAAIESVGGESGGQVSRPIRPRRAPFWPWFTVAMGGAVAAAGGVVNYLAVEDGRKANGLDPFIDKYESRFDGLVRDAQTKMIVAYTGYGLGAVGVGLGLWMVLTQPKGGVVEAERPWEVAPLIGADGPTGLTGTLRF